MSKSELSPIVKTKQGIYVIMSKPVIGMEYVAKCPNCGNSIDIVSSKEQPENVKCSCGAVIAYVGKKDIVNPENSSIEKNSSEQENKESEDKKDEDIPVPTEKFSKHKKNGKRRGIIKWGIWPFNHSYVLTEGINTIGREDEEKPSDIQIKDEYVSRRSVSIDVQDSGNGYLFKFFVRKALNPVYVNGHEHEEGTSVFLNEGDTIRLGSTKLRFSLEEKK